MSNGARTCQVPKNGVLSYSDSLNPGTVMPGCHSNSDSPGTIWGLSSHQAYPPVGVSLDVIVP